MKASLFTYLVNKLVYVLHQYFYSSERCNFVIFCNSPSGKGEVSSALDSDA